MAKNNQKIVIILIVALLIFTSIMAFVISSNTDSDTIKNNNKGSSNNTIISKEISRLSNETEYYAVQNILNDFYTTCLSDNSKDFIKLLEEEYIIENNLSENNVLDIIQNTYDSISYQAEEIYYNANSSITYYFVKGYTLEIPMEDGNPIYSPNINYLVIVESNEYVIRPLNNIADIENFAKEYDIEKINIESNNTFKKFDLTENNKLTAYITNFSNLMYFDVNKAYNMIDDITKKQYIDLDNFTKSRDSISSNLFTEFSVTSSKENEDNIVYKVQNRNGDTITITEYYPNDYKIGFNFVGGE